MKKLISFLTAAILAIALIVVVPKINFEEISSFFVDFGSSKSSESTSEKPENTVVYVNASSIEQKCYEINESKRNCSFIEAFSDGVKNYYCYKIGEVDFTPVYYEKQYYHNGQTKRTYEWSETQTNEKKLSDVASESLNQTVKIENSISTDFKIDSSLSAEYSGLKSSVSDSIGLTLSKSKTTSSSLVTSKSVTDSVSDAWQKRLSVQYVLDKSSAVGYYRYTIFATTEVYAVVTYDKINDSLSYSYFSLVKPDSIFDTFAYSENNFGLKAKEPLSLTSEDLKSLDITTEAPLSQDFLDATSEILFPEYVNDEKVVIDDIGSVLTDYFHWLDKDVNKIDSNSTDFGLCHFQRDVLDLSGLSSFLNSAFNIEFDIAINIAEINPGYQDIYLYDDTIKTETVGTGLIATREQAAARGLVCDTVINHGGNNIFKANKKPGTHSVKWVVSGEKCSEAMTIRYSAHGYNEDSWYKNSISVKVRVVAKA